MNRKSRLGWMGKKAPRSPPQRTARQRASVVLFEGYEATTVTDIMERARVSKGGFYHHFSAKEDLLEALGERMAAETVTRLQPILKHEGLNAVARMNVILSHARRFKVEDAAAIRAAFDVTFKPENIVLYHRLNHAVIKMMLPLFADILRQGRPRPLPIDDPATTAEIILQLGAQRMTRWRAPSKHQRHQAQTRQRPRWTSASVSTASLSTASSDCQWHDFLLRAGICQGGDDNDSQTRGMIGRAGLSYVT